MASPEDKEMKKQWITVDGRQTPIILPQIWDHDKEEWIVTGTNNPLPTQVTGSNVEEQTVFERGIYKSNMFRDIKTPSWAKGLIVATRVYGISGEIREGVSTEVRLGFFNTHFALLSTDYTTAGSVSHLLSFIKDNDFIDAKKAHATHTHVQSNLQPVPNGENRFYIRIDGVFDGNNGVDCESKIYWFL